MDVWDLIWLLWGLAFCVIECIALKRANPGDTFSENVRQWFGTEKGVKDSPMARIKHIALVCFMVWLTLHFLVPGFV